VEKVKLARPPKIPCVSQLFRRPMLEGAETCRLAGGMLAGRFTVPVKPSGEGP
jgi:hypothetical protein